MRRHSPPRLRIEAAHECTVGGICLKVEVRTIGSVKREDVRVVEGERGSVGRGGLIP